MTEEATKVKNYIPINKELVEKSADKREQETGIFHWKNEKGKYVPVTDMFDYEIAEAIEFSESRMNSLQHQIKRRHEEMHHWQHRIDMLQEALEETEKDPDKVSTEAANQQKELTEE